MATEKPSLKLNTSFTDTSDFSETTALTTPSPTSPLEFNTPPSSSALPGTSGTVSSNLIKFSRRVLDRFGNVVEIGTQATRRLTGGGEDDHEGPITRQKNSEPRPLVSNSNNANNNKGQKDENMHRFNDPLALEDEKDANGEIIQDTQVQVPDCLQTGVPLLRITRRKRVTRTFSIDPNSGVVKWDSKLTHRLYVDKIIEIRVGEDARNYREGLRISREYESQWASIMYNNESNKLKALHIVGPNKNEFDSFIGTLKNLVKYRQDLMSGLAMPGDRFVNVHWSRIPKDEKSRISFEDVEKLTRRLHINCSRNFLWQKFIECDVDNSGTLDFEEFQTFVSVMKNRSEVCSVFDSLTKNNDHQQQEKGTSKRERWMNYDVFEHFVLNIQRQDYVTKSEIRRVFDRYASKENGLMNNEGFSDALVSKFFPPLKPVEEDLTRPLNEYFISSSHNTYLVGRQVAGASSVEAYVRALQNGCRCIEIDCWDGENGPMVRHGRAFTTSIAFGDVINAIRKYGFIASPYPLILSLEVHCNSENQKKMVDMLKTILEDHLVEKPIITNYFVLPSPEELKHKILIKVKSESPVVQPSFDEFSGTETFYSTTTDTTTSTFSDEDWNRQQNGLSTKKKKSRRRRQQPKIIVELAELGVYCSGLKFRNFSLPVSKTVNHIFSLSERTANGMIKDSVKNSQMEKHNRRYLMRVYPSAYRVTSKNFDPIQYWKKGVQMVALNLQTNDIGLQINDAMFDSHVGYVHKPAPLLNPHLLKFNQWIKKHCTNHSDNCNRVKVVFDIISAQQLPRPRGMKDDKFEPFVTVEVFGGSTGVSPTGSINSSSSSLTRLKRSDINGGSGGNNGTNGSSSGTGSSSSAGSQATAMKKFRTVNADNGFNPVWGERWEFCANFHEFPLMFVRFGVHTGENMFAVYTARLSNLQQGYRHLPLHDLQGEEYIFSTLFIKSELDH